MCLLSHSCVLLKPYARLEPFTVSAAPLPMLRTCVARRPLPSDVDRKEKKGQITAPMPDFCFRGSVQREGETAREKVRDLIFQRVSSVHLSCTSLSFVVADTFCICCFYTLSVSADIKKLICCNICACALLHFLPSISQAKHN